MTISPKVTEPLVTTSHSCGLTWALPRDATSARRARSLLNDVLTGLGVPDDIVDDAALMVSELATNAYLHTGSAARPELWLCAAGPDQIACAVFDGLPRKVGLGESLDDYGRGLGIVAELSGRRWGSRPAKSRTEPLAVPGKIVWFACTVPAEIVERIACCGLDPLRLHTWLRPAGTGGGAAVPRVSNGSGGSSGSGGPCPSGPRRIR